uniref:Uncharacterized protein n=1 Tax=Arundo donax TaxID=35708 RepID=A0A0A9BFV8_ARUDO
MASLSLPSPFLSYLFSSSKEISSSILRGLMLYPHGFSRFLSHLLRLAGLSS